MVHFLLELLIISKLYFCSLFAQGLRDVSLLFSVEQNYRNIPMQSGVCSWKPDDLQNRLRFQCKLRSVIYPL